MKAYVDNTGVNILPLFHTSRFRFTCGMNDKSELMLY